MNKKIFLAARIGGGEEEVPTECGEIPMVSELEGWVNRSATTLKLPKMSENERPGSFYYKLLKMSRFKPVPSPVFNAYWEVNAVNSVSADAVISKFVHLPNSVNTLK